MKVHTQAEVAAILRRSVATIYRLRMAGALAFIPGRPVTITDDALAAYLTRQDGTPTTATPDAATDPQRDRAAFRYGRRLARYVAAKGKSITPRERGALLARKASRRRTTGATTTTD